MDFMEEGGAAGKAGEKDIEEGEKTIIGETKRAEHKVSYQMSQLHLSLSHLHRLIRGILEKTRRASKRVLPA